jgi:hypothetical protein
METVFRIASKKFSYSPSLLESVSYDLQNGVASPCKIYGYSRLLKFFDGFVKIARISWEQIEARAIPNEVTAVRTNTVQPM